MSSARTSALGRSSYSHGSHWTTTKSAWSSNCVAMSLRADDFPPPQDDCKATVTGSRSGEDTAETTDSTTGPNPSMSTSVGLSSHKRSFSGLVIAPYPLSADLDKLRSHEEHTAVHVYGRRKRVRFCIDVRAGQLRLLPGKLWAVPPALWFCAARFHVFLNVVVCQCVSVFDWCGVSFVCCA